MGEPGLLLRKTLPPASSVLRSDSTGVGVCDNPCKGHSVMTVPVLAERSAARHAATALRASSGVTSVGRSPRRMQRVK
jgi:hypothetical protein